MQKSPKESFLCCCRMGVEAMNEFPPGLTFKGCLTKKLLVDIARRDLLYLRFFGSVMTKSVNKVAMNLPSWKICKIFFFFFFPLGVLVVYGGYLVFWNQNNDDLKLYHETHTNIWFLRHIPLIIWNACKLCLGIEQDLLNPKAVQRKDQFSFHSVLLLK